MSIRPRVLDPCSRSHCARRAAAALAVLLLATLAPAAFTQPSLTGTVAEQEEIIATLRVNGARRGEFTILRHPGGDFWIAADDVRALQLAVREDAKRHSNTGLYYSAAALGAASAVFNEAELLLDLVFAVDALAGTAIDLSTRPAQRPIPSHAGGMSLIASYRLSMQPPVQGRPASGALEADINVRTGGVLLRQETQLLAGAGAGRTWSRGITQAIWDDRARANRLVLGDVVSTAGSFGSAITGAGVLFSRMFDLAPDTVRHPAANLQAYAVLPAEVEVSVDGSTLYRANVGPGPISLNNLQLHGGSRAIRVTVTDVAGRREVFEQPFLFTESVLAQGVHDFSYFLGARSDFTSERTWKYREPAWQGFHRYGVSDSITVSAGGEGGREFATLGSGVTLRSDTLGLLSLEMLANARTTPGSMARGWSARYSYASPGGMLAVSRRGFEDGFRTFTTTALAPFLQQETRVGVSARWWRMTLGADLSRTEDLLGRREVRALRMATNIGPRTTLSAEYQDLKLPLRNDRLLTFYLRHELDSNHWVSTSGTSSSSRRGLDIEAGRPLPQAEGVGYRVGVATNVQHGTLSASTFLSAAYNARNMTLDAYSVAPVKGPGSSYTNVSVSGALVAVDGYWGLTRRVSDGFALARLGVPESGVEILLNNQPLGKTGADGTLLIPQLSSLGQQDVSIGDRTLGLQYTMDQRRLSVTPAYRGGVVIDFGTRRIRAAAGTAVVLRQGLEVPIESRRWVMRSESAAVEVETSRHGNFYLENAPAGRYEGELLGDSHQLLCTMVIPDSEESVQELQGGVRCE